MLFSTVLMWLLIAAGFVIALPALWLLAKALWPKASSRARDAAASGLLKCFLFGLAPAAVGVVTVSAIAKLARSGITSVLIGGLLITSGFIGAGGIATLVGERLWPQLSVTEPWRQTYRGGLVLVCCALLPAIGWFVILPLLAVLGLGVHMRVFFSKAPVTATVSKPPAPTGGGNFA